MAAISARFACFALVASLALTGCGGGGTLTPTPSPTPAPTPTPTPPSADPVTLGFTFAAQDPAWTSAYADYTIGMEPSLAFSATWEQLPSPLQASSGLRHFSRNVSDDLFMYVWRRIDGLRPATRYRLGLTLTIATNAPRGCPGAGGAPGEAVTVKAGLLAEPPAHRTDSGTMVRTAFDKGDQSQAGATSTVLGNLAKPTGVCGDPPLYAEKTLTTDGTGVSATSDASGRLWLYFGTDSGYEGHTALYYLHGMATLTPQ